jgi:hypothetical protein
VIVYLGNMTERSGKGFSGRVVIELVLGFSHENSVFELLYLAINNIKNSNALSESGELLLPILF